MGVMKFDELAENQKLIGNKKITRFEGVLFLCFYS